MAVIFGDKLLKKHGLRPKEIICRLQEDLMQKHCMHCQMFQFLVIQVLKSIVLLRLQF